MHALAIGGLAALLYLLMLARSARKQGEMRQFLTSLLIVAALCAVLGAIVAAAVYFDAH
jgi:hypothetical protein